jgi:hypothetical protein
VLLLQPGDVRPVLTGLLFQTAMVS